MIIGLTGKAGSGKDTVADYLARTYGFKKYSLASPIKQAIASMFNVSEEFLDNRNLKESPRPELCELSYRELAISLGSDWGRKAIKERFNKSLWILLAEKNIDFTKNIVIPDIRFQDEVDWLESKGGVLVHISRKEYTRIDHPSEAGVKRLPNHHVIYNDYNMRQLFIEVDILARYLTLPYQVSEYE